MAKQDTGDEAPEAGARRGGVLRTVDAVPALIGVGAVVLLALALILAYEETAVLLSEIKLWLSESLKFLYLGVVTAALVFCLWLAFGPGGRLRLGVGDEPPDFRFRAWLAMMVGAGMALGLVVWGMAEPLHHLLQNPLIAEEGREGPPATETALRFTMLHWGIHPWAVYCVAAAAFAFAGHRRQQRFSAAGLIGALNREKTPRGLLALVDGIALAVALMAAIAALALAAGQIDESIAILFQFEPTSTQIATAADLAREAAANQGITDPHEIAAMVEAQEPFAVQPVAILAGILLLAGLIVADGLQHGIRQAALGLGLVALVLAAFVLLFGPTVYILETFLETLGLYLSGLLSLGLWANAGDAQSEWQDWWTLFYWAWWLALAIPAGLFIALISRGRTVRQLVGGCLLAAAATTVTWTGITGGAALFTELFGDGGLTDAVKEDPVRAAHAMLDRMPVALFDIELTVLRPVGSLSFALALIGAALVFLSAMVLAIDRLCARSLLPGLLARRLLLASLIAGGAACLWAFGGDPVIQSFRAAVFIGGTLAILLFLAAAVTLVRRIGAETQETGTAGAAAKPGAKRKSS